MHSSVITSHYMTTHTCWRAKRTKRQWQTMKTADQSKKVRKISESKKKGEDGVRMCLTRPNSIPEYAANKFLKVLSDVQRVWHCSPNYERFNKKRDDRSNLSDTRHACMQSSSAMLVLLFYSGKMSDRIHTFVLGMRAHTRNDTTTYLHRTLHTRIDCLCKLHDHLQNILRHIGYCVDYGLW